MTMVHIPYFLIPQSAERSKLESIKTNNMLFYHSNHYPR